MKRPCMAIGPIAVCLSALGGAMTHTAAAAPDISALVERNTGQIALLGGDISYDITFSEMTSDGGFLDPVAWWTNNWAAQNLDAVGVGNGETWEVLEANSNRVVEAFLLGSTFVASNDVLLMGAAGTFAGTSVGDEDLAMSIAMVGGSVKDVPIAYTGTYFGFQPGDTNLDGTVNVLDIDTLYGLFACTDPAVHADLDSDGDADQDDVTFLVVNIGGGKYGDLDGDGVVSLSDLNIYVSNEGMDFGSPNWAAADFNGDGKVNETDLEIMETMLPPQFPKHCSGFFPGDVNLDGEIDAEDINALYAMIGETNPGPIEDVSGDGVIDQTDVNILVQQILHRLFGDANLDGEVNLVDLNAWLHAVPTGAPNWTNGDFDGDTHINLVDLNIWLSTEPPSAAPAIVPEPASLGLLAVGLLVLLRRQSPQHKRDRK